MHDSTAARGGGRLLLGSGSRDITPSFPVMLHGYADRDQLSTAVSEPLSVSALSLQDPSGGQRLVIVALDMIGVHASEVELLRADLAAACGLEAHEILVSASHTHFAPCISLQLFRGPERALLAPDPRYVALVREAVVAAVKDSLAAPSPVDVQVLRSPVGSVLFNRRTIIRESGDARTVETNYLYPDHAELFEFSPADPEVTALRFVDGAAVRAVLVNFGCHPVTGGALAAASHGDISAEYPWHVRKTIAEAWGCPVVFTLGAAGDAVPVLRYGKARQWIGQSVGNAVLLGERVFAAHPEKASRLVHRSVTMEARTIIPTRGLPVEDELATARDALLRAKDPDPAGPESRRFEDASLRVFRARLYPDDRFQVDVGIHWIGGTALVAMPFEVLADTALALKKACPGAVVVSAANGYQGYLPRAYEYARGGYEATAESTHFEPGTMDRLMELVVEELRRGPA